ncbi:hypothetical protein HY639_03400 [Candidatus Woesearchaeota archaeon]|nr:hypothetical protein [Candidatus Woesearchaeota archaeon]
MDSALFTIPNNPPTVPTLVSPAQNETTRTRNPTFIWNASTDEDGDTLTYILQISNVSNFSTAIFNVSGLSTLNFTNNTPLLTTDIPLFWRVRAYDGTDFSNFSTVFNFTIESVNIIFLPLNVVSFGLLSLNETNDTSDNSPYPFLLQNDGNVIVDVTINGSNLWRTVNNPSRFYQFKIRVNETGAFTQATASMNYTNMPLTSSDIDIPSFSFLNDTDAAYIDINITVPSAEYAGARNSTIIFSAVPS